MTITPAHLQHICPTMPLTRANLYAPLLNVYMPKYHIDTPARVAPFLANLAHESMEFSRTLEVASGEAYEGRTNLGNIKPGDGVKFKGRALIQATGRAMYADCSGYLYGDARLLTTPELLEQPGPAVEASCWFWERVKHLNLVADMPDTYTHTFRGDTYNRFEWICFKINGGENGMAQRKVYYKRALELDLKNA